MKKLIVAGCSFSDRWHNPKSYGDYIAEKMNLSYDHQAVSCGSNYRIWRVITNKIMKKEITSDDLLIIQYSEITRSEFCSVEDPTPTDQVSEKYDADSYIIRYKLGAEHWHGKNFVSKFIKNYTKFFIYDKFELEKFKINDYNFKCMLKQNNINAYFFVASWYLPKNIFNSNDLFYDKTYINHDKYRYLPYCASKTDSHHLSDIGMREVANDLINFIKTNK